MRSSREKSSVVPACSPDAANGEPARCGPTSQERSSRSAMSRFKGSLSLGRRSSRALEWPEQRQARKRAEDLLVQRLHRASVYDDDVARIDGRVLHLPAADVLKVESGRLALAADRP